MSDITWLGNRTIMYKGRIAELDGVEDGWAAVRAMQKIDAEINSEIDNMVEKRIKEEVEARVKAELAKRGIE